MSAVNPLRFAPPCDIADAIINYDMLQSLTETQRTHCAIEPVDFKSLLEDHIKMSGIFPDMLRQAAASQDAPTREFINDKVDDLAIESRQVSLKKVRDALNSIAAGDYSQQNLDIIKQFQIVVDFFADLYRNNVGGMRSDLNRQLSGESKGDKQNPHKLLDDIFRDTAIVEALENPLQDLFSLLAKKLEHELTRKAK